MKTSPLAGIGCLSSRTDNIRRPDSHVVYTLDIRKPTSFPRGYWILTFFLYTGGIGEHRDGHAVRERIGADITEQLLNHFGENEHKRYLPRDTKFLCFFGRNF